jgi:leucyl aminopeptidase
MDLHVTAGQIQSFEADAIIVNLFQGVTTPDGATGAVDAALGGQIGELIAGGDFVGKLGETAILYSRGATGAPRVIVVGLGKAEAFDLEAIRRASAAALAAARDRGARHVATITHGAGIGGLDPMAAAQATIEGACLGLYTFDTYKSTKSTAHRHGKGRGKHRDSQDGAAGAHGGVASETAGAAGAGGADGEAAPRAIETLSVVEADAGRVDAIHAGVAAGEAVAAGVALARDLANHPANVATPEYLAEEARAIAKRHHMRVDVWGRKDIVKAGMGALASVAAGSETPPRFIVIEHAPPGTEDDAPYVLAGKAVTFDTGGISLKPGLRMGAMKYDMAGGAAVIGAMEAIGRLGLPLRVIALVGATENMPSGTATRPGDIVTALNGTTIEILNTDAEGRMVLADVLSYASRLAPAAAVDLATLTGAIVVALGPGAAGMFPNDDALAAALAAAGAATGEPVWRMPMWDRPYAKMIESDVADLKNVADSSPAPAGSIFGAKFLERFVDYPWAHLDIAGVAWDAKDVPYLPKGATGFGVRLLVEWLRGVAGRSS